MSVVFRKTQNNYYVVSPMGLISPMSFVTKNDNEFKRAKLIYNVFLAITVVLLSGHYRMFNDNPDPMRWPSFGIIMIGIMVFLYTILVFSFSKPETFKSKIHGAIIKK